MAITVTKNFDFFNELGTEHVLFSDNDNIAEFISTQEGVQQDFKFKITITVTSQTGTVTNTVPSMTYTTYRQYGYINLYTIINNSRLYSGLEILTNTPSDNQFLIKRSLLSVVVVETWINSLGVRVEGNSATLNGGKTVYLHKGKSSKPCIFAPEKPITIKYNEFNEDFYFQIRPKNMLNYHIAVYNNLTEQTFLDVASADGSDFYFRLLPKVRFSQFDNIKVYECNNGEKLNLLYEFVKDKCIENNFIQWRNDVGFLDFFNFCHSHEIGSSSTGQDYYTDFKRTAIVSTQKTVTLTTDYIDEYTYSYLLNILKSPEVYWNNVPVVPKRTGVKYLQKRFEQLMSLTIEFEIAQKERSLLL